MASVIDTTLDAAGDFLRGIFGWIAPSEGEVDWLTGKKKRAARARGKVRRGVVEMAEPAPGPVGGPLKDPPLSVKQAKAVHGKLLKETTKKEAELELPESADARAARIESEAPAVVAKKGKKVKKKVDPEVWLPGARPLSKKQRHLLFVNVGDEGIKRAARALAAGAALPKWALPFRGHLTQSKGRLRFDGKPFLLRAEMADKVRECYFNPKLPATQKAIADYLVRRYANVGKRNAAAALKNIETYQLNFGRRLPPKNGFARTSYKTPGGIIAIDTFYPSKAIHGWRGNYSVLCCVDAWSRYSRAYPCAHKGASLIRRALSEFLREFAGFGHPPRRIMSDKGSELHVSRALMERYRQAKDGDRPMVLKSPTGTPILLVEAMNAQYQRRMQTFRTSGLTNDPAAVLKDISDQLNNQPRPTRGNLSPVQLLALSAAQRRVLNDRFADRQRQPAVLPGLKPIAVGAPVRVLNMTRKEQVVAGKVKGFGPKWSSEIFTVLKRQALRGSAHFRYFLNKRGPVAGQGSYYRHELLAIPSRTPDRRAPDMINPSSYRLLEGGAKSKIPLTAAQDEEWVPGMD